MLQAVYTLTVEGKLLGIIATHVDDLLYGFDGPVGQGLINHIKQVRQAVEDGLCGICSTACGVGCCGTGR